MKTAKDAENFIDSYSGDTTTFEGFIDFVCKAYKFGFVVFPYTQLKPSSRKKDKNELGAVVVRHFKDGKTGKKIEVACNPILKLKKQ